jgi:hypothetical protein
LDGSQFRFGVNIDGELEFFSKRAQLFPGAVTKMFVEGVKYLLSIKDRFDQLCGCYWFCEYMQRPKHNALKYNRIPKNHLMLFDMWDVDHWAGRNMLTMFAGRFDIDVVPELFVGETTVEALIELHKTESYLGGPAVEGVVIKNYHELMFVGGTTFPVFTKLVRQEFQELNKSGWRKHSGKGKLQEFMESFCTEARWRKAVQHLRDEGLLQNAPQDIGSLMKEIHQDLVAEEADEIKEALYTMFIKDIKRAAARGFPEWYKSQLLENVQGPVDSTLDKP